MKKRPPIVVIMGHIDHGKTSLLAKIRNIAMPDEPGQITQQLGAFHAGDITFIDTPGHEYFSAMRTTGACGADLAVLVIAANEGIKKQTKEAYKIAQNANLPIIITVNKIDLPNPRTEAIKQEFPDDLIVEVSAETGQGIPELLEAIRLQAEELDLSASTTEKLKYNILEIHHDPNKGEYIDLIVCSGKLPKVKRIENQNGEVIKKAPIGLPIRVYGLDIDLNLTPSTKKGRKIIIKAKNQGSLQALSAIFSKFQVLHSGIGNITEKDIIKADSETLIIGFQVKVTNPAQKEADKRGLNIITDQIIYKLEEKIKELPEKPKIEKRIRKNIGQIKIIATFKNLEDGMIIGGPVISGQAELNASADIVRAEEKIGGGQIKELQNKNKDAKIVEEGQEAGLYLQTKGKIKIGDILEIWKVD